jgi:hypothetical protein
MKTAAVFFLLVVMNNRLFAQNNDIAIKEAIQWMYQPPKEVIAKLKGKGYVTNPAQTETDPHSITVVNSNTDSKVLGVIVSAREFDKSSDIAIIYEGIERNKKYTVELEEQNIGFDETLTKVLNYKKNENDPYTEYYRESPTSSSLVNMRLNNLFAKKRYMKKEPDDKRTYLLYLYYDIENRNHNSKYYKKREIEDKWIPETSIEMPEQNFWFMLPAKSQIKFNSSKDSFTLTWPEGDLTKNPVTANVIDNSAKLGTDAFGIPLLKEELLFRILDNLPTPRIDSVIYKSDKNTKYEICIVEGDGVMNKKPFISVVFWMKNNEKFIYGKYFTYSRADGIAIRSKLRKSLCTTFKNLQYEPQKKQKPVL